MWEFFAKLWDVTDFPARWQCGNWSTAHGLLHIVSDFAIAGAYAAIPIALAYFVLRRKDVPFLPIFWLFSAFILTCGVGHFLEAFIFWHPWYRLTGLVKCCTAIVSWVAVLAMLPALPKALALPGLAAVNQHLAQSNDELQRFANVLVDREDRIIELKEEINRLFREQGREPKYLRDSDDA